MHIDDLVELDSAGAPPIDPGDVVYIDVAMRILIPRHMDPPCERMTMAEWVEFYMLNAYDVRVSRLGPGISVKICARGHVMPEDEVHAIAARPATAEEPGEPEREDCSDCVDEAIAAEEERRDA